MSNYIGSFGGRKTLFYFDGSFIEIILHLKCLILMYLP